MKILFLHTLFHPHVVGGAEVVLRSQALLLQEAGHEVAIATLGPEPGVREEMVDGLRVFRCGHRNLYFHHGDKAPSWKRLLWHALDRRNPFTRPLVREVLDRFRPDVAWFHNVTGWSVTSWDELERAGVPVVQVLHDQYFLCANSNMFRGGANCATPCLRCRVLRAGHRQATRKVAAVVGVSRFVLDRVCSGPRFEGVPLRELLYNVKEGGLPPLSAPRLPDGTFRLGFIGSLYPNKGAKELLEAFRKLPGDHLRLRVAGRGDVSYLAVLQEIAAGDPRIELLGYCSPAEFFPSIDLAVVPSLWQDTLPTVVFEAHGYGVPVLGSRRGGIPEMVVPGENGDLFDPDVPGDLEAKLAAMVGTSTWDHAAIRQGAERFYLHAPWMDRFLSISRSAMAAQTRRP